MIGIVPVTFCCAWLLGYARAVAPFASDFLHDLNFTFLTYPNVKFYRVFDDKTEQMSSLRLELFSVADGPTGVEYNEAYLPCWTISLGALGGLVVGVWMVSSDQLRKWRRGEWDRPSEN